MRPISTGVASGSSLAVALKALNWLDTPRDPIQFCNTLGLAVSNNFDWFAFSLGLIVGALLFAVLEFLITLRWLIRPWFSAGRDSPSKLSKPLYKLC